jgi:hypothetical protein
MKLTSPLQKKDILLSRDTGLAHEVPLEALIGIDQVIPNLTANKYRRQM